MTAPDQPPRAAVGGPAGSGKTASPYVDTVNTAR